MPNENSGINPLLSAEGLIFLPAAGAIDILQMVFEPIPIAGQIIALIIDVVALIFFGSWMYLRSRKIQTTKKTQERLGKMAKWAKRLKWLRPVFFFLEFASVGALPMWTVSVYFELKYSS